MGLARTFECCPQELACLRQDVPGDVRRQSPEKARCKVRGWRGAATVAQWSRPLVYGGFSYTLGRLLEFLRMPVLISVCWDLTSYLISACGIGPSLGNLSATPSERNVRNRCGKDLPPSAGATEADAGLFLVRSPRSSLAPLRAASSKTPEFQHPKRALMNEGHELTH